jgi:hypothetical protein
MVPLKLFFNNSIYKTKSKMENEEEHQYNADHGNNEWRSCCFTADRHVIVYVSQLLVACSVLGFSGFMLHMGDGDCEKSSPYLGLISFILGKLLSSVTPS